MKNKRGFTLAEVLIVVAIITVLLAIGIPSVISIAKNLRQKELDTKAEIMYTAVQNALSKMKTAGNADKYAINDQELAGIPIDIIYEYDDNDEPISRNLHYLTINNEQAKKILENEFDDEIINHSWIIEYEPSGGYVYGIFYSEKKNLTEEYISDWETYNMFRSRKERFDNGAWVGYYGGDNTSSSISTDVLKPTISITNGEKLTAHLQCVVPENISNVTFKLKLKDGFGHSYTETLSNELIHFGKTYSYDLTLDDLSKASTRFNSLYGYESGHYIDDILVPGTKLTLELTATSSNHTVAPGKATAVTNSLFADGSTETGAQILFGRHLQNLDESSCVTEQITSAALGSDISLEDSGSDGWIDSYWTYFNGTFENKPNFKSIQNNNIKTLDGNRYIISGLNISSSDPAGLFKYINGNTSIQNLSIAGSKVISSDAQVGTLVGTVEGENNSIVGCGVYLRRDDVKGMTEYDVKISGTSSGGLVGTVAGDLSVSDSFASSVIYGSSYSAGLIGKIESGTVIINTSYADSYISGTHTAGIANGNVKEIKNCYAAGFQDAIIDAAGLINGNLQKSVNCYTISSAKAEKSYSTAKIITSAYKTYYFSHGSTSEYDVINTEVIGMKSIQEMKDLLGEAYQTDTSDTFPYNLREQGLSSYSYPRLVANRHYGDWLAEFQVGSLVYYEKYSNGTYGFYGANVSSTLKNSVDVVGDGYGIVYKNSDAIPAVEIKIEDGDYFAVNMGNDAYNTAKGSDGIQYRIYPLDKELINSAPGTSEFYKKIEIKITDSGNQISKEFYYFNPLFAKSIVHANDENAEKPVDIDSIYLRTPRHLYNLSLYYDASYVTSTQYSTYIQERDINYSVYEWTEFTLETKSVRSQEPIGKQSSTAFRAKYNGDYNKISDVSFTSYDGQYVGLFGFNTGIIRNVVLVAIYDPNADSHYYVQRQKNVDPNEIVYMGALAGYNTGTINNSAIAGYYIAGSDGTLHAYTDSTLYAGGFVGGNSGVIRSCTADSPAIRLSSLYANARLAGFVSRNLSSGIISDCYCIGYLEVAESRGGSVYATGFAGKNEGRISGSYCATAMTTSGESAQSYGFAPKGGVISNCCYLDKGSYRYISTLYSYLNTEERTSGKPCTYRELQSKAAGQAAGPLRSYCHPNTNDTSGYPFRAVVKDAAGRRVHYGEWVEAPNLGNLGIFYWEKEENGSNNGYHITYIGTVEGVEDSGTTLCTAHDDGGVISQFGYGYYVHIDEIEQVTARTEGLKTSILESGKPGIYNSAASAALKNQMSQYEFYPYTTRVSEVGDYVYLDNGESRTGKIILTFKNSNGDETEYSYTVTPFFANAMKRDGAVSPMLITSSDWNVTNYAEDPGTDKNPYEIRSTQQFRYINWNYKEKNCDTLVYANKENPTTIGNFTEFPFLQYATVLEPGIQNRTDVEALRSPQTWLQTHDIKSMNDDEYITPIAGMGTSSPFSSGGYTNFLYAWFGGKYDGQSYKIQNINVVSESYSVGLFGATARAEIKNIVLYADNDTSRIERATKGKTAVNIAGVSVNFEKGPGAYFVGGLVGIAYEYKTNKITNKISNCTIAGYSIIDRSTNQQGAGTANVGGLIGLANVNLEKCSSNVDIIIDCTHDYGHMAWGSHIRIGGLAGSAGAPGASLSINDCYTGGSIQVSEQTLNEAPSRYTTGGFAVRDKESVGYSLNLYVSGFIGGSYAPNISNFTNQTTNAPDGTAHIENCYTYIKLPNLEGTIRAISLFANQGDRYGKNTHIYISNCYYLDSIAESIEHPRRDNPSTWPSYYFEVTANLVEGRRLPTTEEMNRMLNGDTELIEKFNKRVISDEEFAAMLNGDLSYLCKYLYSSGTTNCKTEGTAMPITYEELCGSDMASRLGTNWGFVTTTEQSGADISGKYSFSDNPAQTGKNYPFPTVITQKDNTYSTAREKIYVNVHYGAWPINGYYWENGRVFMDVFANLQPDGYAYMDCMLIYDRKQDFDPAFTISANERAEIVSVENSVENSRYTVTVKALSSGAATITEIHSGASFVMNITGKIKISTNPATLSMFQNVPATITLYAKSAEDSSLDFSTSENGTWLLTAADEDDEELFFFSRAESSPVNEMRIVQYEAGQRSIAVTYQYDYNGSVFTETTFVRAKSTGQIGLSNGQIHYGSLRSVTNKTIDDEVNFTPLTGPELFLFGSSADGDLESFEILSLEINNEALPEFGEVYFNEHFYVRFLSKVTQDSFDIIPIYVRFIGDPQPAGQEYSVKLVIRDPITEAIYSISMPVIIPEYVISFNANGGEGIIYDMGVTGGEFVVPSCTFTRTGYSVSLWIDENGINYSAGDVIIVSENKELSAVWEPNSYTIRFNPNGGSGEMTDAEILYDSFYTLPKASFAAPSLSSIFLGWNTMPDGTGSGFADESEVHNLTSENNGIVTLYAQWGGKRYISLSVGDDVIMTTVASGNKVEEHTLPNVDGWEFEGWFTQISADATKILDPDGYINVDATDIPGYTQSGLFNLTSNKTLYARWKRTAFVPVTALTGNQDENLNYVDNGTYLIVSSKEQGTRRILTTASKTTLSSATVTVYGITAFNSVGDSISVFIPDMEDVKGKWTVSFASFVSKEGPGYSYSYPYFTIKSVRYNDMYLRDNINSLTLKNTATDYTTFGGYNGKQVWTFGVKHEDQLQSGFHSATGMESAAADKCLYWNGTKFVTNAADKTCAMFKQETIYSFYAE